MFSGLNANGESSVKNAENDTELGTYGDLQGLGGRGLSAYKHRVELVLGYHMR